MGEINFNPAILASNLKALRKGMGMIQEEFAQKMGIPRTTYSNYEQSVSQPSLGDLLKIGQVFDVTIDSLLQRDLSIIAKPLSDNVLLSGKPLKPSKTGKLSEKSPTTSPTSTAFEPQNQYASMPKVVTVDSIGRENVTFVSQKARAGYLAGYGDAEYIASLPAIYWPNLPLGTYRIFEADGVSMQPTVKHRDWLLCRYVENLAEIKDNWVYTVVTHTEGIAIKRFLNRVEKDHQLIGKSDNRKFQQEHGMLLIDAPDVKEVWLGWRNITAQLGPPDELHERVTELEARVALFEQKLQNRKLN